MTIQFFMFLTATGFFIMSIAWFLERKTNRSGYIDAVWAINVGLLSLIAIFYVGATFRSTILALIISFWSFRLSSYLWKRGSVKDDPRYEALKTQWGKNASLQLFIFLQIQAFCAIILSCSLLLSAQKHTIDFLDILAAIIIIIALMGEALADKQLNDFRNMGIRNGVCNNGLWKYSRHPNYFFEFLFWCGIALSAINLNEGSPISILAFAAPIMMYLLLRYASGIPPLEAYMLQTRGEVFAEYQQTTSPFFPLPPKESKR